MPSIPARATFIVYVIGFSVAGFFVGRATTGSSTPKSSQVSVSASALPSFRPSAIPQSATPFPDSAPPSFTPAEWKSLLAAPSSPAAEQTLLDSLRTLAATNPTLALELAKNAPTPRQRDTFVRAVLQGWASADPMQAATWTLANVRTGERRLAAEAIIAGASANPDEAIRTVTFLCSADPQSTSDYGNALVSEFARTGRFELASQFAASGPAEYRAAWLSTAYFSWAQYQPAAAIDSTARITDPAARTEALQGVIAGWAVTDPAALVAYAQKLPLGETRLSAFRDGLQQWVTLDPAAASEWMDAFDPSPDLDAGAAAVATAPALVARKPDIAASWAESITDPELRANTLLDLIQLWAQHDPGSARRYAANTPAINSERRALILSSLEPAP